LQCTDIYTFCFSDDADTDVSLH